MNRGEVRFAFLKESAVWIRRRCNGGSVQDCPVVLIVVLKRVNAVICRLPDCKVVVYTTGEFDIQLDCLRRAGYDFVVRE